MWQVIPILLAGILGLAAHAAPEAADYVPRLRAVFLGGLLLGYVALAIFVFRKSRGWQRWGLLLTGLVALRIAYAPILQLGVWSTTLIERVGRALGGSALSGTTHYALGVFIAFFAFLACLLAVAAATNVKRVRWAIVLALWLGLGVLAFWFPEDRTILPHRLDAENAVAPSVDRPDFAETMLSRDAGAVPRIVAAFETVRDAATIRSGWGGALRQEYRMRICSRPEASFTERIGALEASLLRARNCLRRTSPRTPPGSGEPPPPGRS